MRYTHLALLTLATSLAAFAGSAKDITYLQGSLDGVSSNAAATLDLSNSKVMVIKSDGKKFEIPYLAVTGSESKEQVVFDEKEPLYKVWTLKDRLLPPMPLQEVTLHYKNDKGAQSTLTLEMTKSFSRKLEARLAKAEERKQELGGAWWGDSVWKTKRNEEQWGGAEEYIARK